MKYKKLLIALISVFCLASDMYCQESRSSGIRRENRNNNGTGSASSITGTSRRNIDRSKTRQAEDSELAWMKVVYRQLDLTKAQNAVLYFPEEGSDGDYNLFRLMLSLLASGEIDAYEYLDGRESYAEDNKLKVKDMLDRFQIYYTEGKGYSEKHQVFNIEEIDMPSNEILTYYIIERWELDRRDTRMHRRIEAICPVMHRSEEFGYEAVKYPMFWMRYEDLRPYLTDKLIFTDDDNNAPTSTFDDYFTLGLYDGEIYKTRNLRNKSMMELYPDPEERKRAQDSIDNRLASFERNIWVPDINDNEITANETLGQSGEKKNSGSRGSINRSSSKKKADKRVASRRSQSSATRSVRSRKE